MPRLFVFSIGGTGARVLRSLTLLLSAGMEPRDDKGNLYEIIPLMIDPDASNGNVAQTIRLLETYQEIRSSLSGTMPSDTFFHASIKELSSLKVDDKMAISKGYKLTVPNVDGTTFGNFINYQGLPAFQGNGNSGGDGTKEFLELLYTHDNLSTQLHIGFQGFPNMGAVVLNQFISMPAFQFFANVFVPGDKIFIISSIFGGTGAAGFPLLVKNLRNPNPQLPNFASINQATLGAIIVQPYFNLQPDGNSPIDANQFITKTKAALSYYEKNLTGVNALYYIGDQPQSVFNNTPGGGNQKNLAHFVELASALAIFDFLHSPNGVKEFGLSVATDRIDFSHLSQRTYSLLYKPLARMWLLNQYLKKEISRDDAFKQRFYTTNPVINESDYNGNKFFTNIQEIVSEFESWLKEMSTTAVAFDPFDPNPPYKKVLDGIRGYKSSKWSLLRNDQDQIVNKINRQSDNFSSHSKSDKFVIGLSKAFNTVI